MARKPTVEEMRECWFFKAKSFLKRMNNPELKKKSLNMDSISQAALGAAIGEAVLGKKAGNKGAVLGLLQRASCSSESLVNRAFLIYMTFLETLPWNNKPLSIFLKYNLQPIFLNTISGYIN